MNSDNDMGIPKINTSHLLYMNPFFTGPIKKGPLEAL